MYINGGKFKQRIDHSFNVLNKINNNTYDQRSSLGSRYRLQKAGVNLIKENPFFGVGTADQFSMLRNNPNNKNNPIQHLLDVHNQYIDILMQFGIVGFLIYFNLIYRTTKFKAITQERNTIKNLVMISMLWTGFWATFSYFLPVFFTALIIITTANKKILANEIKCMTSKELILYILVAIFCYNYEQLQ
jgi:O-antigen ligase